MIPSNIATSVEPISSVRRLKRRYDRIDELAVRIPITAVVRTTNQNGTIIKVSKPLLLAPNPTTLRGNAAFRMS
jgi:hypothetical protein